MDLKEAVLRARALNYKLDIIVDEIHSRGSAGIYTDHYYIDYRMTQLKNSINTFLEHDHPAMDELRANAIKLGILEKSG